MAIACAMAVLLEHLSFHNVSHRHISKKNVKGVVALMYPSILYIYCMGKILKWPGSNHTMQYFPGLDKSS